MRLWIRYLAGTIIGVVLGVFLPAGAGDSLVVLQNLSDLVIRLGRFLLFPIAFFSAIIAVDELRDDRRVLSVTLRTVLFSALTVVVAAVAGLVAVVVLQPQRVPPMVQEAFVAQPDTAGALIRGALPYNGFRILTGSENALGMIVVLAILIGWNLRFDREITSPVSLVADSANRILYRLNAFLTDWLGFLVAIPAGMIIVELRLTEDFVLFSQFLIVVTAAALFVGLVVYPVVLYLVSKSSRRVLGWVTGMGAPGLAALAGGDVYFAAPTLIREVKEDLGVPRRVGGVVTYLLFVWNRAGTTLVATAGFLLVVRSYTALEMGIVETVQVVIAGVFGSFLLGRVPAGGVIALLSYLAVAYGRGMEESYLILLPVMPLLERLGAWLDVMTHGFVTNLVTDMEGLHRE
ncbi:MAG: cation:dicarboxylate symporter family transporter [Alkalispirochaeta sp.]